MLKSSIHPMFLSQGMPEGEFLDTVETEESSSIAGNSLLPETSLAISGRGGTHMT